MGYRLGLISNNLIPYNHGSDTNLSHPNQWRKHWSETYKIVQKHHDTKVSLVLKFKVHTVQEIVYIVDLQN